MTRIQGFSIFEQHREPVTAEEGLRMIKVFESLSRKTDRDAVLALAERLAGVYSEQPDN